MELESAVKQTLNEAEKIKSQIQTLLDALLKNSQIVEVGLVPIAKDDLEDHVLVSAPPTRKSDNLQNLYTRSGTTFTILETETFLIPLIDKWVWGTTIKNSSEFTANLPELHLMLTNDSNTEIDQGRNSNCVLSYNYSVSLVEVPIDTLKTKNFEDCVSIPFQEIFQTETDSQNYANPIKVQPGCKAMVTACFGDPLQNSSKVTLSATIFCNKIYQWSTTFDIKPIDAYRLYNNKKFKKFRPQIFSALSGQHQNILKMERRFSQLDKSPARVFPKFLTSLGFNVIQSVQTGLDTWIDTLISDSPTLFYGLLIKIERHLRDIDSNHCLVAATSSVQMNTFLKLISKWEKQESSEDLKQGLKGLLISTHLSNINEENCSLLLSQEIELVEHMIRLYDRQLLSSDFSKKWLMAYFPCAARNDAHFMK